MIDGNDTVYEPDIFSNKSVLHEPCLIVVNDAGKYRFDSICKSFRSDLIVRI